MSRIPDAMLFRDVGAGKQFHRRVLGNIFDLAFCEVGVFIDAEFRIRAAHFQRKEITLGILQNIVYRGSLGQDLRVFWGKPQGFFSFHDGFSQPHGDGGNTFFRLHFGKRVVIVRLGNPRDGRVKIIAVSFTNQLLNDHRHLLFFRSLTDPPGKCFGALKICGGIHQLDGVYQLRQSRIEIRVIVGNHVGTIKTGVSTQLGVFQQAGGSYGQRIGYSGQKGFQVIGNPLGKFCFAELFCNLLIRHIQLRQPFQIICLDKRLESFSGDHHGLGNKNIHLFKFFVDRGKSLQ